MTPAKHLTDNERISRFIPKKRFIQNGYVSPAAFQLRSHKDEKFLSMYRVDGISVQEKWKAGDRAYCNTGCCGSADFIANQFQPIGLEAIQDLPSRHVSVHGIPTDDEPKALRIAQELSRIAVPHRR